MHEPLSVLLSHHFLIFEYEYVFLDVSASIDPVLMKIMPLNRFFYTLEYGGHTLSTYRLTRARGAFIRLSQDDTLTRLFSAYVRNPYINKKA